MKHILIAFHFIFLSLFVHAEIEIISRPKVQSCDRFPIVSIDNILFDYRSLLLLSSENIILYALQLENSESMGDLDDISNGIIPKSELPFNVNLGSESELGLRDGRYWFTVDSSMRNETILDFEFVIDCVVSMASIVSGPSQLLSRDSAGAFLLSTNDEDYNDDQYIAVYDRVLGSSLNASIRNDEDLFDGSIGLQIETEPTSYSDTCVYHVNISVNLTGQYSDLIQITHTSLYYQLSSTQASLVLENVLAGTIPLNHHRQIEQVVASENLETTSLIGSGTGEIDIDLDKTLETDCSRYSLFSALVVKQKLMASFDHLESDNTEEEEEEEEDVSLSPTSTPTKILDSQKTKNFFIFSEVSKPSLHTWSTYNYGAQGDGTHLFQVATVDDAGNMAGSVSWDWTIDLHSVRTVIDSRPAAVVDSSAAMFRLSCYLYQGSKQKKQQCYYKYVVITTELTDDVSQTDDGDKGLNFNDGLDYEPEVFISSNKGYLTLSSLNVGIHTLRARACLLVKINDPEEEEDELCDPQYASSSWVIDTSSPDTFITLIDGADASSSSSSNHASTTTSTMNFALTSSKSSTTALASLFLCRFQEHSTGSIKPLNGEEDEVVVDIWKSCSATVGLEGLGLGLHTLEARAVDDAGDVDPTPASYSWLTQPTVARIADCPKHLRRDSSVVTVLLTTSTSFDPKDTPCTDPAFSLLCEVQYQFLRNDRPFQPMNYTARMDESVDIEDTDVYTSFATFSAMLSHSWEWEISIPLLLLPTEEIGNYSLKVWPIVQNEISTLTNFAYLTAPIEFTTEWNAISSNTSNTSPYKWGLNQFLSLYAIQCDYIYNPYIQYVEVLIQPESVSSSTSAYFEFDSSCNEMCCEYQVYSNQEEGKDADWLKTNTTLSFQILKSDSYTLSIKYCLGYSESTYVNWRVELSSPVISTSSLLTSSPNPTFPFGINSGHASFNIAANRLSCRFFYYLNMKEVSVHNMTNSTREEEIDTLNTYPPTSSPISDYPPFSLSSVKNGDNEWVEVTSETYNSDDVEMINSLHHNLSWAQFSVSASSSPIHSKYGNLMDLSLYVIALDELNLVSIPTFIASWFVDQRIPRTLILSAPPALSVSSEAPFQFACALNTTQFNGVGLVPEVHFWFNSTPPPFAMSGDGGDDNGEDDDKDDKIEHVDDEEDGDNDNVNSGSQESSNDEGSDDGNEESFSEDVESDGVGCQCNLPSSSSAEAENCPCKCTFEYKMDSFAGWLPTSNPVTLWHIPEGSHRIQVRSVRVDNGVADPTPVTFDWSIELALPKLSFLSTPQSPLHDTSANFKFASNKPIEASTYYMMLIKKEEEDDSAQQGGRWERIEVSPQDGSFSFLLIENGYYEVYFAMQDERSGQWDTAAASGYHLKHEIILDRSRPETFVLSSPVNPSQTMTPAFFISSNHQDAHFDYCVDRSFTRLENQIEHSSSENEDGSEEVNEQSNNANLKSGQCWYDVNNDFINIDGMVEGTHNLTVRATITEWSETSSTYSVKKDEVPALVGWEVDADAPDTAFLLSQPAFAETEDSTHLQSIVFAWASSEPVKKFSIQIEEGSTWVDLELYGSDDDDVACLAANPCSLTIASYRRKLSTKGNTLTPHGDRSLMIDTPDLPITWYYSASIGGEDVDTLDVLTLVVNDLIDGPHRISVRSVDRANNFDASPASVSFVVDSALKPSLPASPCAVSAEASDSSAIVSWLPLSDDGLDPFVGIAYFTVVGTTYFSGSPMYSFHIVKGPASATTEDSLTSAVSPLSIDEHGRYFTRVEDLQNKNMYKFSVTSRNSAGLSSSMSWSSDWVTPFDPSDPCSSVDCNDDPAEMVQGGSCFLLRNNDGDLRGMCVCRPGFTGTDCRSTASSTTLSATSSSTSSTIHASSWVVSPFGGCSRTCGDEMPSSFKARDVSCGTFTNGFIDESEAGLSSGGVCEDIAAPEETEDCEVFSCGEDFLYVSLTISDIRYEAVSFDHRAVEAFQHSISLELSQALNIQESRISDINFFSTKDSSSLQLNAFDDVGYSEATRWTGEQGGVKSWSYSNHDDNDGSDEDDQVEDIIGIVIRLRISKDNLGDQHLAQIAAQLSGAVSTPGSKLLSSGHFLRHTVQFATSGGSLGPSITHTRVWSLLRFILDSIAAFGVILIALSCIGFRIAQQGQKWVKSSTSSTRLSSLILGSSSSPSSSPSSSLPVKHDIDILDRLLTSFYTHFYPLRYNDNEFDVSNSHDDDGKLTSKTSNGSIEITSRVMPAQCISLEKNNIAYEIDVVDRISKKLQNCHVNNDDDEARENQDTLRSGQETLFQRLKDSLFSPYQALVPTTTAIKKVANQISVLNASSIPVVNAIEAPCSSFIAQPHIVDIRELEDLAVQERNRAAASAD